MKKGSKYGRLQDTEHFFEHSLSLKKQYSVGVYTGFKGPWSSLSKSEQESALGKRWYVRWAFRNPATGRLERQENIYGGVNYYRSYKERIEVLNAHRDNLIRILKSGYNPYTGSPAFNLDHLVSRNTIDCINRALEVKRLHMKKASFIRYRSDIAKFTRYLTKKGFDARLIDSVTKSVISEYLSHVLDKVSPRSRNNYLTNIQSLFESMVESGVITSNPVKGIPAITVKPKRNLAYTERQTRVIFDYLARNNPRLLLFIQFVAYNFLRPLEVCRLTAGSFNIPDRTLTVMVKQGREKTKIIPEILFRELPDLSGYPPKTPLFSQDGFLSPWDISENAKRGAFSREFKLVKDHFGLSEDHTMYGFRHTFITKLYRKMRSELSPYEVKSRLMLITGHSTMSALEAYLRSLDAELPEDYSDLL